MGNKKRDWNEAERKAQEEYQKRLKATKDREYEERQDKKWQE